MVTSLWKNKVVIDTLKTFPVVSNFWTYDYVEASNFMIDTCDENIIAMYHFTDDDRVMGSIDEAKKLTQTVKNSKYTTKYIEEIGRIHVSLLTSNGKEIDENSYAYELAEISGGFVYSGIIQDEPAPMVMRLALTEDTTKTEQTKETNGNLTEILGEGNNGKFTVITSTGLIDSVKLKTVLNDSNGTDTDLDGLYDWDEVNTELIGKHLELENKQELKTINNSDLPLFSDLILHTSEWGSFKPYLWTESDFARYAYANCFDNVRILPIVSDPSKADSDGDGIVDCMKNDLITEYTGKDDIRSFLYDEHPLYKDFIFEWPVYENDKKAYKLTSSFTEFECIERNQKAHCAIDIAAPNGSPVYASASGIVTYSGYSKSWGNTVEILSVINGKIFLAKYNHLSAFNVSIGDYITSNSLLGFVGNTGYSFGNHLDFLVSYIGNGSQKDVEKYIATQFTSFNLTINPLLFNKRINWNDRANFSVDKIKTGEDDKYNMIINFPQLLEHKCSDPNCHQCKISAEEIKGRIIQK